MWIEPRGRQIRAEKAGIHLDQEQSRAINLDATGRQSDRRNIGIERLNQMSITEIDANGRIRLPMGIRDKLDLNDGDKLAIDQLGDGTIILKSLPKEWA